MPMLLSICLIGSVANKDSGLKKRVSFRMEYAEPPGFKQRSSLRKKMQSLT